MTKLQSEDSLKRDPVVRPFPRIAANPGRLNLSAPRAAVSPQNWSGTDFQAAGAALDAPLRHAIVQGVMALTDFLGMIVAIALAGVIAQFFAEDVLGGHYQAWDMEILGAQLRIWGVMICGMIVWFSMHNGYSAQRRQPFNLELKAFLEVLTVLVLLDGFVEYASKQNFSRLWLFAVWPIAALIVPLARITARKCLSKAGLWRVRGIAIGSGDHRGLAEQLCLDNSYLGYEMAAQMPLNAFPSDSFQEWSAHLSRELSRWRSETVFLVPSLQEVDKISGIVNTLNMCRIPYMVVLPISRLPFAGLTLQSMMTSDTILLTSQSGLLSPLRQRMKRAFDIVVSAVLLAILSPLFLVLGLWIARDGGPVFYGHKRVGKDGKSFGCLKLRSMCMNSDEVLAKLLASDPKAKEEWDRNFKLEQDPRITKLGRILRSSSLDELPQLVNVLKGEMSLVGPRPVVAQELDQYYGQDVHYYRMVRPGLTGLWQVSGRSTTTYERRVFLDAWYVRNWTLWMDIRIFFSTIPSVLAQRGAR